MRAKRMFLVSFLLAACTGTAVVQDDDHDGFDRAHDCDDTDAAVFPGADEVWYDGADQDCDGRSDYDQDHDGADAADHGGDDCLDTDPDVYVGADPVWYDGVDNGCDGGDDYDRDGDGYDSSAFGGTDCDDFRARTHPGATDEWYDGTDSDCGGNSDYDRDGDDYESDAHGGSDCDDTDPAVHPRAADPPGDGADDDCDGWDGGAALGSGAVPGQILGDADNDVVGSSVAGGGDVNGDGVADILLGAPGAVRGASGGLAAIVLGPLTGSVPVDDADAILLGAGNGAGTSVAFAGDVDGDGFDDVLVGAPAGHEGSSAYLVAGPVTGTGSLGDADAVLSGSSSSYLGWSVGAAGDLDADGLADFAIGACCGVQGGVVYLFRGPASGLSSPSQADAVIGPSGDLDQLGRALAAGDIDGDGLDDLVVGARYAGGRVMTGAAYVFLAPFDGPIAVADASTSIFGAAADDQLGAAVGGVGDTDGDGYDDVLLGAPGFAAGGVETGAAFLFTTLQTPRLTVADAEATLLGEQDSAAAGTAVAAAGDADGDGRPDLLVGAPGQRDDWDDVAGAAYVTFSPVSGAVPLHSADRRLAADPDADQLGAAVASAGDIDGDGLGDILVTAPYADVGGSWTGAVYLVTGAEW